MSASVSRGSSSLRRGASSHSDVKTVDEDENSDKPSTSLPAHTPSFVSATIQDFIHTNIDVEKVIEKTVDDLIELQFRNVILALHHDAKTGVLTIEDECDVEKIDPKYHVHRDYGFDIFGYPLSKKTPTCECTCPQCERTISASRFAPHLEKCMGLGRTSSRVASRRIANSGKVENTHDLDVCQDDENDRDWVAESRRPSANKRRERRSRGLVVGVGGVTSSGLGSVRSGRAGTSSPALPVTPTPPLDNDPVLTDTVEMEGMGSLGAEGGEASPAITTAGEQIGLLYDTNSDKLKSFLSTSCGVVSEHTGKMCTRSMRCPQHSDDQRQSLRDKLSTDKVVDDDDARMSDIDGDVSIIADNDCI